MVGRRRHPLVLAALVAIDLLACGPPPPSAHSAEAAAGPELPLALLEPRPYPTRSAFFGAPGAPAAHSYCHRPDPSFVYSDYLFFAQLAEVSVGASRDVAPFTGSSPQSWENMGFEAAAPKRWRRLARLDRADELVAAELPGEGAIDCIAISSIDRGNGRRPYIYPTLISLLEILPPGAQINVLVGNANVDYLAAERLLAEGVAPEHLGQLHILPAAAEEADYLAHAFADSVRRRASWNYARALRSYRGQRGLLFMEDDVIWTRRALEHFNALITADPLPVVSLFDPSCQHIDPSERRANRLGRRPLAFHKPIMNDKFAFFCTQAMYYSADVANELGRYLQPRMHEDGYDQMIERFMRRHGLQMGYATPSLVQHIGRSSTGLSQWFPSSPCFAPELPPLAAAAGP